MNFLKWFRKPKPEDFTPEEVEKILEGGRQADKGFTFTPIGNGVDVWLFACDQCGSVGDLDSPQPFPHEEDCPTRLYLLARARGTA